MKKKMRQNKSLAKDMNLLKDKKFLWELNVDGTDEKPDSFIRGESPEREPILNLY